MARFFRTAAGSVGLLRDDGSDPVADIPAGATVLADFDETAPANAAVVAEFSDGYDRFGHAAGQLTRDGSPVAFAADSPDRAARRGLKSQLQDRLAEADATAAQADATVAAVQPVIDGVDGSTNAQLRAMVKTLAQGLKQTVQEQKSLARNQKRIIRTLARLV